jgi:hypothetical protein
MWGPGGRRWRALRGHVLTCFGPSECRHRLQKITTNFCEPLAPPPGGGGISIPHAMRGVAHAPPPNVALSSA